MGWDYFTYYRQPAHFVADIWHRHLAEMEHDRELSEESHSKSKQPNRRGPGIIEEEVPFPDD